MRELVYIQLKKRVQASVNDSLTLEHIAHITTNSPQKQKLLKTPIYEIKKNDHDVFVIDYFIIVKHLVSLFPNHSFHLIGKPQAMIQIQKEKKSKSILFVIAVWIILRSEEHTSELQSRGHLVCRLLLEKKNESTDTPMINTNKE